MMRNALVTGVSLLAALCVAATPAAEERNTLPVDSEIVFVLDTTGSMSGLIEGAKKKIWSIANDVQRLSGNGRIRVGFVIYRDRGDQYVTRIHPLSDDLDGVFGTLQKFQAAGGGDAPESVNQALHEAVTKIPWSADPAVMKAVFLVGDCPPHMDYQDDVKYPESCRLAARKNIMIHAIQCGTDLATTPIWREIARLTDGDFAAIGQTGNMQQISTPYDAEIAELTRKVGATVIPYGSPRQQREVSEKLRRSSGASASVLADRNAFNLVAAPVVKAAKAITGAGDLVADAPTAAELAKLEKEEISPEFRSATPEQLAGIISERRAEREKLNLALAELNDRRNDFLKKQAASKGAGDSFDGLLRKSIARQLHKVRGVRVTE